MARGGKSLTDTQIAKAKPKLENGALVENCLYDKVGLQLVVTPKGRKIWRFNYCKPITKKRTEISLGKYPEISLQQARKLRDEYLVLLAQGITPTFLYPNLRERSHSQYLLL
ncbi:integrase arm-type DNA-binding domain-containing protein [Pasteurellaceae bacterium 22721_9_1]